MAAGYGFAGHIGLSKETSGGTPVAAANFIEALSESVTAQFDRFEYQNIINGYYEGDDATGVKRVGGSISTAFHPELAGHFLRGTLAAPSVTVVLSGSLHTNVFKPATGDWDTVYAQQPYTIEMFRDVTSAQEYTGVNFNTLELNVSPNQELRMSAELIGTDETNKSKETASYVNSPVAPFTFDTASVEIGGAANAKLESLSVSINNQLEGVPSLNNSSIIRAIRRTGPVLVRVSGTIAFEDITEYLNYLNQTEQAFKVSFFKTQSFALTIDVPRLVYSSFPLGMSGRDRQVVSFDGMARYKVTSATALQIDLTNTTSGY